MGELVHQRQRQLRATVQNRGDIQLRKAPFPVGDRAGGKHFEIGVLRLDGPATRPVAEGFAWIAGLLIATVPAAIIRYRRATSA